MAQTVIGMFDNATEAQQAVEKLTSKGFSKESIDVSNSGSAATSYSHDNSSTEESGIVKFFKNLFSSDDDDSEKYSTVAKRSGSIVTVHTQSAEDAEDAADILDDCGAVNVDERAASYGYTGTKSTGGLTAGEFDTTGESKKIPIIEENLEVGKREVLTGGVRLKSRIVERPVEESVRLREENVTVERTPVDRVATSADLFEGKVIEMTETAEVPVVAKEARVVEEVSLGKDVSERTETISDTVRKTEVDVEDLGKTDVTTKSGF